VTLNIPVVLHTPAYARAHTQHKRIVLLMVSLSTRAINCPICRPTHCRVVLQYAYI